MCQTQSETATRLRSGHDPAGGWTTRRGVPVRGDEFLCVGHSIRSWLPKDRDSLETRQTMKGKISSVKADRGFFFIKPSDGSDEVFGHARELAFDSGLLFGPELLGQTVEFNIAETPKGRAAKDIRRA